MHHFKAFIFGYFLMGSNNSGLDSINLFILTIFILRGFYMFKTILCQLKISLLTLCNVNNVNGVISLFIIIIMLYLFYAIFFFAYFPECCQNI